MERMVTVLLGIIVAATSQEVDTCIDTVIFHRHCCNVKGSDENRAILKQCFEVAHDPFSCTFEKCYGEKKGFLLSNGTIDKIVLEKSIQKDLENYTEIYDVVKEKCLIDDLSVYGEEESCYLKELGNCLHFHAMVKCPNWIESDECKRVKDTIEDCEKLFS